MESAAAGARVLIDLPALRGLAVRVVSVVDAPFPTALASTDSGMPTYAAIEAYDNSLPALRDAMGNIARERAAALSAAGVTATSEVREGDAAAQLIEAAVADRSDCIVMGAAAGRAWRACSSAASHARCSSMRRARC